MIRKDTLDAYTNTDLVKALTPDTGIKVIFKNTTGNPPPAKEATVVINNVDRTYSVYILGAWRVLGTFVTPPPSGGGLQFPLTFPLVFSGGSMGIALPDPVVDGSDTLPAADSTWRGSVYTLYGGAGVADHTYVCQKDALDAYNWVEI